MEARALFQDNTYNIAQASSSRRGGMKTPSRTPKDYQRRGKLSPALVSVFEKSSKDYRKQSMKRLDIQSDSRSSSPTKSPRKQAGTPLSTRSNEISMNSPPKRRNTRNGENVDQIFSTPDRKTSRIKPTSSGRRNRYTPSRSMGDRFIPNRSDMRFDICRSNIFSAEKSRLEVLEKEIKASSNGGEQMNGHGRSSEILTPAQSEYRARMRGILLDIPLGNQPAQTNNTTANDETHSNTSTSNGFNGVIPDLGSRSTSSSSLYGQLSRDKEGENIDPMERMMSFKRSVSNNSDVSSGCSTPSRTIRQIARSTPDPHSHNQIRAFDRVGGCTFSYPSYDSNLPSSASKTTRKINSAPTRILDAPELVDDYYLNLISWGKDNILAVALGQCVYLWNAGTGDIQHLLNLSGEEDYVTSVRWADMPGQSNYLAIGTNDGPVQLWDARAMKKIDTLRGHAARVGSLAWTQNILSSGGRDSVIIQHDIRDSNRVVSTYAGHTQEVCGLEWNEDGTTLASGGNENYLCIWDAAMSARRSNNGRNMNNRSRDSPRLLLTQHQAAVKALAWCPFHRGLLASGGGTADRTIKFWNSNSGALLNSIDTGSQVCSLLWSKHQRELCSSHGFSENQLILWRYPTMTKIQEFKGHTARVSTSLCLGVTF